MKALSSISLLAGLVAIAIMMTGNAKLADKVVNTKRGGLNKAIATARGSNVNQNFSTLYQSAVADAVGNSTFPPEKQLIPQLVADQPQANVGKPLKNGGTAVKVFGNKVVFCAQTDIFHCRAYQLHSAARGDGSSKKLKKAVKRALKALAGPAPGAAPARAGKSGTPAPPGNGVPANIIERAKGAASQGG